MKQKTSSDLKIKRRIVNNYNTSPENVAMHKKRYKAISYKRLEQLIEFKESVLALAQEVMSDMTPTEVGKILGNENNTYMNGFRFLNNVFRSRDDKFMIRSVLIHNCIKVIKYKRGYCR